MQATIGHAQSGARGTPTTLPTAPQPAPSSRHTSSEIETSPVPLGYWRHGFLD